MSHTPGPCGCCLEPVDDEKEASDLCSEATGAYNGIGWRIERCPLHAAAPELLAALKDLLVLADPTGPEATAEWDGRRGTASPEDTLDAARAAIAKAEGERA